MTSLVRLTSPRRATAGAARMHPDSPPATCYAGAAGGGERALTPRRSDKAEVSD